MFLHLQHRNLRRLKSTLQLKSYGHEGIILSNFKTMVNMSNYFDEFQSSWLKTLIIKNGGFVASVKCLGLIVTII